MRYVLKTKEEEATTLSTGLNILSNLIVTHDGPLQANTINVEKLNLNGVSHEETHESIAEIISSLEVEIYKLQGEVSSLKKKESFPIIETPKYGSLYYSTYDSKIKYWDGYAWKDTTV